MPFKSVKWWSGVCCNIAMLAGGWTFASSMAWATVTVTPASPYVISNSTVDYAWFLEGTSVLLEKDFKNFDLTKTQFGTLVGTSEDYDDRRNMIQFDIESDKTFTVTGTQKLVVTAVAELTNGGSVPVPIAFAAGDDCSAGSNCQNELLADGSTFLLSARYTEKTKLTIGLYPADICLGGEAQSAAQSDAISVQGCGNKVLDTPDSSAAVKMYLTFFISVAPDASSVGPTDSAQEKSSKITLAFHRVKPSVSCSSSALDNGFFPGDQQIYLNTEVATASIEAGGATITEMVVVGKDGAAPVTTSLFNSENEVVARFPFPSGTQSVPGLTNTTDGNDHKYQLAFTVKDAAGILADFDTSSSSKCLLEGAQAATIQGFLDKSSCFIATAAFRSGESGPVVMLREFRDRLLLSWGPGRTFVKWYYHWSPDAAKWLMEHPVFRVPVLLALVPVQFVAWFFLHPLVLIGLAFFGFFLTLLAWAFINVCKREGQISC
jgi:hypothetical protein